MRGREAFRDAKSTHRPGPVPLPRARSARAEASFIEGTKLFSANGRKPNEPFIHLGEPGMTERERRHESRHLGSYKSGRCEYEYSVSSDMNNTVLADLKNQDPGDHAVTQALHAGAIAQVRGAELPGWGGRLKMPSHFHTSP